ncbi:MAG: SPASM domain-containing protein [Brevinematales bacterium]|nr:SPASM domain-containing protein [Brevinematales bacterium]
MMKFVVIKDVEYSNPLFDRIPFDKVFVSPDYRDLLESLDENRKVVITWNSSTLIDLSLVERLYSEDAEISFISNLPSYMEFEVWDTEFLRKVLNKYQRVSKPLRDVMLPIELDESIYYTDVLEDDIRLFRWYLDPKSFKGQELSKKVLEFVDLKSNVVSQLRDFVNGNPSLLVEIPSFYYVEVSSSGVDSEYLPRWVNSYKDMSPDEFSYIVSKILDYSKTFGMCIGIFNEPLYGKYIDGILSKILEYKGKKVTFIFTTSLGVSNEILKEVYRETIGVVGFESSFFNVFVDIPTHVKENYLRIKKIDYEKVLKNLKELYDIDPSRIYLRFVRYTSNDKDLPSFYEYFKDYNKIIQKPQIRDLVSVDTILPTRIPCYKLSTTLVVLPNGDVPLCINDASISVLLGNMFKDSIDSIALAKSKIISEHMNGKFFGVCKDCVIWDQFDL